jgi:hypothetical protein
LESWAAREMLEIGFWIRPTGHIKLSGSAILFVPVASRTLEHVEELQTMGRVFPIVYHGLPHLASAPARADDKCGLAQHLRASPQDIAQQCRIFYHISHGHCVI